MPKLMLDLSEDTVDILMMLGRRIGVPNELPIEEYIETTISFVVDSVDAQMDVAVTGEGEPMDFEEALNKTMNPDISTEFVQPRQGMTINEEECQFLTLEEIKAKGGLHGKDVDDAIMQEAIRIVYSQLDEEQWDSESCERLVDKTVQMLQARLSGRALE